MSMIRHVKFLRRQPRTWAGLLLAAAMALSASTAVRAADPDAQAILKNARMAQTGQVRTLKGHLRVQSSGEIIPFTLVLNGGHVIRYQFKDKAILLRLGPNGSQLMEAAHGDMKKVAPARYDQRVEGTDITYEDISLNFLYWPKAKLDGSDPIGVQDCWKLHLEPGGMPSAYAVVLLWVAKGPGAILGKRRGLRQPRKTGEAISRS